MLTPKSDRPRTSEWQVSSNYAQWNGSLDRQVRSLKMWLIDRPLQLSATSEGVFAWSGNCCEFRFSEVTSRPISPETLFGALFRILILSLAAFCSFLLLRHPFVLCMYVKVFRYYEGIFRYAENSSRCPCHPLQHQPPEIQIRYLSTCEWLCLSFPIMSPCISHCTPKKTFGLFWSARHIQSRILVRS